LSRTLKTNTFRATSFWLPRVFTFCSRPISDFTAPTIHAGFSGKIALEMINLADYPITLYPGVEICQLIIEQLVSTPFQNPSEFQDQAAPTGPR